MKRAALLLALAAAAPPERSAADGERYRACLAAARAQPTRAIELAGAWRIEGGGVPARHCLALALMAEGKPAAARAELEGAARAADTARDPLAGALWGQAGNAALLSGDAAAARAHFTTALARLAADAPAPARSGLLIDRARAGVAAGDLPRARADLDAAIALSPADPLARRLSAALATRMGDDARAEAELAEARRLDPGAPADAME